VSISKDLYDIIENFNPMNKSIFVEELLYYGIEVFKVKKEINTKLTNVAIQNIDLNSLNFEEMLKKKRK